MKLLLFLVVIFMFLNPALSQNWPNMGGNNQRNNYTKMPGPVSLEQLWSVNSSYATVIGNRVLTWDDLFATARVVFSPQYHGVIELRSLLDGSLLWSKDLGPTSILYTVGFTEDAVYAHDYSNDSLYALDLADGSIKWRIGESKLFPGNNGLVFACDGDPIDFGRRIDKHTGEIVWQYDYIIPVGPSGGFALYGNTYYHWTGSIVTPKKLIAVDADKGDFLYESEELPGDGDQEIPLMIGPDGTIYITRDGGQLYAFEDNGEEFSVKWTNPYTIIVRSVGPDGKLFGIEPNFNYLVSLDPADGTVLDTAFFEFPYPMMNCITVTEDEVVYATDNYDKIYAFSYDLSEVLWELPLNNHVYSDPAPSKEGIMVLIGNGTNIKAYQNDIDRKPVADFGTDSTMIYTGSSLNFYDHSSFAPTSWEWTFEGSNTPTSDLQNPTGIVYDLSGIFEVTLIASNAYGSDTIVRSCYIEVNNPVNIRDKGRLQRQSSVYPNPFRENFTIYSASEPIVIELLDVMGRIVKPIYHGSFQNNEDLCITIDGKDLQKGIYFIRIVSRDGREILKLIKQ